MSLVLYIAAGCTIATIYLLFTYFPLFKNIWHANRALKQFPMEPYYWFSGHLFKHPGQTHEGLMQFAAWTSKYPRYMGFYFGPFRPVLILNHPETIKQLVKTEEPKCVTGGGGYALLLPWIGEGLLISNGPKWFRNRRLLTPGFHFDILKPYMNVYNSCVEKFMDIIDKNSVQIGQSMDVYNPVGLCTLDIILQCAFSTNRDIQGQGDNDPYVNAVKELSALLVSRSFKPYLYVAWLYALTKEGKRFQHLCDYTHQFATNIINKRRDELEKEGDKERTRYVDFLDILLLARDDQGKGLNDLEIREEVDTFMFEGHDTTASGISWILYNLARHSDFQARARDEVDELLNDRNSDWIQWSDINNMPYLTMCIKESLRLHPPVYFISRETSKPFAIDGKVLPPGAIVDISIWDMHHNANVWDDPFTYDPDRFLPDRISTMDPYAFLPFSAGPRNCIGQAFAMNEMKTTIARILRRYEFTVDTSKETKMLPDVVLRSKSGVHIRFKKREKEAI